jgi:hypothetical protein
LVLVLVGHDSAQRLPSPARLLCRPGCQFQSRSRIGAKSHRVMIEMGMEEMLPVPPLPLPLPLPLPPPPPMRALVKTRHSITNALTLGLAECTTMACPLAMVRGNSKKSCRTDRVLFTLPTPFSFSFCFRDAG